MVTCCPPQTDVDNGSMSAVWLCYQQISLDDSKQSSGTRGPGGSRHADRHHRCRQRRPRPRHVAHPRRPRRHDHAPPIPENAAAAATETGATAGTSNSDAAAGAQVVVLAVPAAVDRPDRRDHGLEPRRQGRHRRDQPADARRRTAARPRSPRSSRCSCLTRTSSRRSTPRSRRARPIRRSAASRPTATSPATTSPPSRPSSTWSSRSASGPSTRAPLGQRPDPRGHGLAEHPAQHGRRHVAGCVGPRRPRDRRRGHCRQPQLIDAARSRPPR